MLPRVCIRPGVACVRLMSSSRDGPPPWAARQIPSGETFTAMKMVKMQNKEIWRKRMKYINEPWQQIFRDYTRRQAEQMNKPTDPPPKLLMVRQVENTFGRPKKEKNILKHLGIKEKWKPIVVLNKEENTAQLKHVKHLVEILPVTFPFGEPKTAEDLEHGYLCDNGAFVVKKTINTGEQLPDQVSVCVEAPENKYEMTQELIDRTVELKKVRYQMNEEYYPTKYIYTKNQDKKEWRYKGNTDIGYDKIWH